MDVSNKTIADIKNILDTIEEPELSVFLSSMKKDPRTQVQKLAKSKRSSMNRKLNEDIRLSGLLSYERKLYKRGFDLIAGVDEAGRGALAGPVVAAAVVLPKELRICGVRDSKQLSPQKRDALYNEIIANAVTWNVVCIESNEIDSNGIQWANLQALSRAVVGLNPLPDFVLSDAFFLSEISTPSLSLVKGDAKSLSIAAASILAKVSRDRIMLDYHKSFPQYEFDKHKGYGTTSHMNNIAQHGITPIHRTSFSPCSELKQISLDIFPAQNIDKNTAQQLQ